MPTDFTNIIFDEIIEKLALIINNEFSVPIYYDEHKGNQSFILTPQSDELVTYLSSGVQRAYQIEVNYQLKIGGQFTKNNMKQVSNIMERLKRLVYNERTQSNGSEWFSANISSVEYERDEDDSTLLRGIAIFECQNTEVM